MKLTLREKFLILSAVVQALVLGLLIWNSLRVLDSAVSKNAYRVTHEYAVTLNLSLSPYASSGRLAEIRPYLSEMLYDPQDSFVRYIVILDAQGQPVMVAGKAPPNLAYLFSGPHTLTDGALKTELVGAMLNARAPLLLNNGEVGALCFGISTEDLSQARGEVLHQGLLISVVGFALGLSLFYLFTSGIARRLAALTVQSMRLARGDFDQLLPEHGGDELDVFSQSLNIMSRALRERIAELDLTERRLHESEARFQILFDTAPVSLSVTTGQGKLLAVNHAMTQMFGHPREQMLGRSTNEIRFWAFAGERERVWSTHQRDGVVRGLAARIELPDGSHGDVAIWSSALVLDGVSCVVWALLDLSEEFNAKRKLKDLNTSLETRVRERSAELERSNADLSQALETLKRTQNDLISSEKMASLGSLVAGVAHELNTPIGNSLLAATTLAERVQDFRREVVDGTLRRSTLNAHLDDALLACTLISGSLHKAAHLIASFKQVAVDQTHDERRPFVLRTVLEDTLATYAPRLRRANCGSSLDINEGPDIDDALQLVSYPGSLCQVMNNLINNALAHAFDQQPDAAIKLCARALDGEHIEILFGDNGAGMADDVLRHVFDPFFTTKMGQGGTGLGMNIVYNLVTGVLGGQISIDTQLGEGTTVRIVIPKIAPLRENGKKG